MDLHVQAALHDCDAVVESMKTAQERLDRLKKRGVLGEGEYETIRDRVVQVSSFIEHIQPRCHNLNPDGSYGDTKQLNIEGV